MDFPSASPLRPPPPRVTTLADDRSYVVERTYQRYVKATKGGAHCLRASSDHEEQQLGKIGVAQVHGGLGAGGGVWERHAANVQRNGPRSAGG